MPWLSQVSGWPYNGALLWQRVGLQDPEGWMPLKSHTDLVSDALHNVTPHNNTHGVQSTFDTS